MRFPKIFVLTCSDQNKYFLLWFSNSNFAIFSIICSCSSHRRVICSCGNYLEDFDYRHILFDNEEIVHYSHHHNVQPQTTPPPVHHSHLGADLVKLHTWQIIMTMTTNLRGAAVIFGSKQYLLLWFSNSNHSHLRADLVKLHTLQIISGEQRSVRWPKSCRAEPSPLHRSPARWE